MGVGLVVEVGGVWIGRVGVVAVVVDVHLVGDVLVEVRGRQRRRGSVRSGSEKSNKGVN